MDETTYQPEGYEPDETPPLPAEAFDGETKVTKVEHTGCDHYLIKVRPDTVECRVCKNGWQDPTFVNLLLKDGEVVY